MVARWSANPLGILWPEMDAASVTAGGGSPPARFGGRSSSSPQDKASKATHGTARGNAGVNVVVDVTPRDNFELIPSQTSGATKNAAADELTWFAVEVGE